MLEPSPCQSTNNNSLETLNTVLLQWENKMNVSYYLQLLPGEHCIRNSSFIRDGANMTIVGGGSVVIKCLPGQGLLFYNVKSLRLASIVIDGCGLELDHIRTFVEVVKTDLNFFFELSNVSDQYIAMALGNCEDFCWQST